MKKLKLYNESKSNIKVIEFSIGGYNFMCELNGKVMSNVRKIKIYFTGLRHNLKRVVIEGDKLETYKFFFTITFGSYPDEYYIEWEDNIEESKMYRLKSDAIFVRTQRSDWDDNGFRGLTEPVKVYIDHFKVNMVDGEYV